MHQSILSDIALERQAELIRAAEERRRLSAANREQFAQRHPVRGLRALLAWVPFRGAASHRLPDVEETPLFRGLPRRDLALLARKADAVSFDAGAVLARETDPRPEFLVIAHGVAEASRRGRRIALLCAGDHFGEQALLDGKPDVPTITALTDVDAFILARRDFRDVLHKVPAVSVRLLSHMAEELRRMQYEPPRYEPGKAVVQLD
jgi:cyclic nucleotide-binding protein